MRSVNEYVPCPHPSCKGWARVERGGHGYRDRLICHTCGCIVVTDNVPQGIQLKLAEKNDGRTDDGEEKWGELTDEHRVIQ